MYICKYKENYLDCIAEMERKSYPPELQLGLDGLREELGIPYGIYSPFNSKFDSVKDDEPFSSKEDDEPFSSMENDEEIEEEPIPSVNRSLLAFCNGELTGYIIAYTKNNDRVYISDLNCTDKSALMQLLAKFFLNEDIPERIRYEAECRPASFKLLFHNRFKEAIRITSEEKIEDYYAKGEHAYKVIFEIEKSKITDWRLHYSAHLAGLLGTAGLADFFDYMKMNFPNATIEEIDRAKGFIIKINNIHNLSIYEMFGDNISILAERKMVFKSSLAAQRYCKKLSLNGYKEEDSEIRDNQPETYMLHDRILFTTHKYDFPITSSYHDLSSARHIYHVLIKKLQRDSKKSCVFYDKFGVPITLGFAPPYCNRKTWEYALRYYAESKRLDSRIPYDNGPYGNEYNNPSYNLRQLIKVLGFKDAVRIIDDIVDLKIEKYESTVNFIHDWNFVISELIDSKRFLTKGAFITCLSSSYNSAKKYSEIVRAIATMVEETEKHKRKTIVITLPNYVRKELSARIRKGKDLASLMEELEQLVSKLQSQALKLTKREEKAAAEFVKRMSRYVMYMNTARFFAALGNSLAKKILLGNVEGLFQPKEYHIGDKILCAEVLALLNTRSRQAKRVYSDLLRLDCLSAVMLGVLDSDQRSEVLRVLKLRNCILSENAQIAPLFSARIEPKCSPEFLAAGDASVCCMSFGASNALEYATEEGFGILNIYYKERIIANSVLWIEEEQNCLVLDNIEVHPNYVDYNPHIAELYRIATADIMRSYDLDFTVQGQGYSDLQLEKEDGCEVALQLAKARKVSREYFYSDARSAYKVNLAEQSEYLAA